MQIKLFCFFKKYLLLISFSCFILSLSFINLISKNKDFSQNENRYLQQRPKFSVNKFINNNFSEKYEKFINDQFIFRDNWITIKMLTEVLLLKQENNNIIIGKDNYLFDKLININNHKINQNIDNIINFINYKNKSKIYFSLIPSSYQILKDKLPRNLKNIDQKQYINKIYKDLLSKRFNNFKLINSFDFLENKKEQVYYFTDHHWTVTGAYYFYFGISENLDYRPVNINLIKKYKIKDFYGTYYSRAKIFWKQPDNIFFYRAPIDSMIADDKTYYNLYNIKKFSERDKYAGFLYGNHGLCVINSKESKNKKDHICIIKDSYANSLIPFLTYNYNKIYVIDLRYIKQEDLNKFFNQNNINDILIIYSFSNFVSDSCLEKLEYLHKT